MPCIDLIITDQSNVFKDSGAYPSLGEHCQHQIIYGKLNILVRYLPVYKRRVWDYSKANVRKTSDTSNSVGVKAEFSDQTPESMAAGFTEQLLYIVTDNIPNRIVKFSE